jgi:kelch-like protein 10
MNKGRDLRNKAIKFKNEIYTIGGNFFDGEKLDLRSNSWEEIKPYNDLVSENLDSWCSALSYNSHEYELEKCQEMSKILKKKYKDYPGTQMRRFEDEEV